MKKVIAMAVLVMAGAIVAQAQLKREYSNMGSTSPVFSVTASPDIPASVTFAGEKVPTLEEALAVFPRAGIFLNIHCKTGDAAPEVADLLWRTGRLAQGTMDYNAYSSAKAAGIWQLLAGTARDYGLEVNDEVDERFDPEKSTVAACKYLKAAYKKYGHWPTVAASYNAGMQRLTNELSKQKVDNSFDLYLVQETSRYVFRIIAYKLVMENPKRYGYRLSRQHLYQPVGYTVVDVTGPVASWIDWAKGKGITYAQLREANPWIRSTKLTNAGGKTYKVRVPKQGDLYRSKRTFTTYNKDWVID